MYVGVCACIACECVFVYVGVCACVACECVFVYVGVCVRVACAVSECVCAHAFVHT